MSDVAGAAAAAPSGNASGEATLTHPKVNSTAPTPRQTETEGDETEGYGEERAVKREPAKEKKKYKVKDGDDELEVDEDEVVRGYQRARAANRKFEEASQVKKQVESFVQALKANPWQALQQLGIDPDEAAYSRVKTKIEREMMSPEEIRAQKEREEYELDREELKKYKEQEAKVKFEQEKARAFDSYAKKFTQALEAADIPRSPFTVKRMAEYERQARQAGYELTAQELGELVKEDFHGERSPAYETMNGKQLINYLGTGAVEKIREEILRQAQPKATSEQGSFTPAQKKPTQKKALTVLEWQEMRRQKYGV